MRKMKDSGIEWIGKIPEDWEIQSLKYNVKIEMGQSPSSECYNSDGAGFPFLQGNADFTDKYPKERVYTTTANKISKVGDLLLSVRAPVGAINLSDKEYAIGRGLCTITEKNILIQYLWYAINILKKGFYANATGSTFESINTADVGNSKIMVPNKEEQKRIANYLDKKCAEIDALIEAKEKANALLKEQRQSIIYEAVTKGLNPNVPMKDSGIEWIGKIPKNWDLKKIKYCFTLIAGATPKSSDSEYWDGNVVWITPADYKTEDVFVSRGHKNITEAGVASCSTTIVPENSIIFSKRAPVGLVALNAVPLCTNQGCISCVPQNGIDSKFYYYAMSAFAEQFELFASGTTFKEISADDFANFKLPYTSYDEQKTISDHLDKECENINNLMEANKITIEKLREYRKSIIFEAVTGKVEI